jgi:hypothetical protein
VGWHKEDWLARNLFNIALEYVVRQLSVQVTATIFYESMLRALERKILRWICGPVQEKGRWHSRWSNNIYSLYKDLNIIADIKITRLGWAGGVVRMEDERSPKKVNRKVYKTGPIWKPRTRWEDAIQRDALQFLGVQGWRRWAGDREGWKG